MNYFLADEKIIGVVRSLSFNEMKCKFELLNRLGLKIIEICFHSEFVLESIKWAKQNFPDIKLGIASIIELNQVKSILEQNIFEKNLDFITMPMVDSNIINFCIQQQINFISGATTPTEIVQIINQCNFNQANSIPYIKLFPTYSAEFYWGIQKVFHQQEFILSSFPINQFTDLHKTKNCRFAIGSYLTDTESFSESKERLSKLQNIILKNTI